MLLGLLVYRRGSKPLRNKVKFPKMYATLGHYRKIKIVSTLIQQLIQENARPFFQNAKLTVA